MQFGKYKQILPKIVWVVFFLSVGIKAQQNELFLKKLDSLKKANNYTEFIYTSLDEYAKKPNIQNLIIFENTALKLWRKAIDKNEYLAEIYFNVNYGYHLKNFGFINESIIYYEKAKRIFEDHPSLNYDIIEFCYKPLANNYTRLGDYERAEDLLKVTISRAELKKDRKNTLAAYSNLAIVKRSLGELDKAIEYLNFILKQDPSESLASKVYSDLAINYLLLNTIENAERMLNLSNSIAKDAKVVSKNLQTQGNIYVLKNDFKQAFLTFEKALPLIKTQFGKHDREVGKLYNQMAKCKIGMDNSSDAIDYFKLSLEALIPKFKNVEFNEALKENLVYPENTLLESFDGLASVNTSLGNLEKALFYYDYAFLVEEQLQQSYTTQQAKLVQQQQNRNRSERCIDICYELFKQTNINVWIERAFSYAEKSKSTILNEVRTSSLNKSSLKEDTIFIAERELLFKKAQLNKKIAIEELKGDKASIHFLANYTKARDEISNKLQLLKQNINNKYPSLNQSSGTISSSTIQKEILKEGQELVEFFNGTQFIYRFLISKDTDMSIEKIEKNEMFNTTLTNFLNLFVTGNRAKIQNNIIEYVSLGVKLYNLLFFKIESKSLIVIPDGSLAFIPYDALLTNNSNSSNFEKLPYFVKNTELQLAFSASLLSLTNPNIKTKNLNVLGFFPIFKEENRGLATLPYTEQELNSIKSNWDGTYFKNEEAIKATFKNRSETASIIHLSTHASAGNFSVPPSIEFFDETLFLPEIYGYNFSADLLVLSACETGLGVLRKGEGALSLARGFLYAGVKNIIVSLWKVNDKSTQELMAEFYRVLKKTNNKSGALHQAKLNYLKNSSIPSIKKSPYYWAGFTYIGENSIPNNTNWKFWWLVFPLFLVAGFFLLKKR